MPNQQNEAVPSEAMDTIFARKILSVIGLENDETPVSQGALIQGAGGMAMGIGVCPPGNGPDLHAHLNTYETFTVLKGRFEIRWNDDGSESLILEQFDTISIPPGVCRAFKNISDSEGMLQAIITGGVHDMNDIAFSRTVGEKLGGQFPDALDYFKKVGFSFDASRHDA
ncbi:cupin domain-containing protein [Sphingobium sp. HWE2-09]|uniref:cupin domain-containing protein n=1 Tax=Sphingobium sp. HWE2-09 TaxID=3108390 RepID=UPI002DD2B8AB|nr:cupin domain-containing protein [Sphingobium sp. HWE2-09]MEC3947785.1 cupin domain-containing protein [Sphingobium sp. HWE2-09]